MRAQGLTIQSSQGSVEKVIHDRVGVQAQDLDHVPLAIRARSSGLTLTDVSTARYDERSIIRTWCMRGSLHFVASTDLAWILSLFGPLYVRRGQRRLTELGLDETDCERVVELLHEALGEQGPLTREEVARHLLQEGFEFDPSGQAPYHIVRRLCLEGIACEATPRGDTETYGLLDNWLDFDPTAEDGTALAELARRYLSAYEPATLEDFYHWSGLYKRDARTGWDAIADDRTEVELVGERAWIVSSSDDIPVEADESPLVRLLPMYDNLLLGHHNRDLHVPEKYQDQIHPGGGIIRSTVLVDGVIRGTWTFDRTGPTPTIQAELFEPVDSSTESCIAREVGDVGRFLDQDVSMDISES